VAFKDAATARGAGRLGGLARAAKLREKHEPPAPYAGDFLTFREAVGRGGLTRALWTVLWRAVDGLPLDAEQLAAWRLHTGRQDAPTTPCRETWVPAGRRSGKSENVMLRVTHRCISRDWTRQLSAGEVGVVPIVASDRDQARNSLRYLKGLARHPLVTPYVAAVKRDSVAFTTGAEVRVVTASWRATRGYTFLDVVLEECAFYADEASADPDVEILAAVRPALLTVPDARIYGISSPYARKGILYAAVTEHWGQSGDDVLVFNASTEAFNPTVPAATIRRAFDEDPARAASEYGSEGLVSFRSDVSSLFDMSVLRAAVVPGRHELARAAGITYTAFVDVSGGSSDAFCCAVAHAEDVKPTRPVTPADAERVAEQRARGEIASRAVVDATREWLVPFNPDTATAECAAFLKSYGLRAVIGDRYGAAWVTQRFQSHGITYQPSERNKSEIYLAALPLLNAGRVELLDKPRLLAQLAQLERRTTRGTGRDVIDHPQSAAAHDDLGNAVCGAVVLVGEPRTMPGVSFESWDL
jgi:hypothetical protein